LHPTWDHEDPDAPIFDIYVSNFLAQQKKIKMLFISAEKSKQDKIIKFMKELYDGEPK